jgi:hypothetical protein
MILIDLLQAGGYRFKQATLRKMQTAYFEILKAFVKHLDMPDVGNFIISGCAVVGPNITAGMMYIDGELCEFSNTPGTDATLIKKNVVYTNLVFKAGSSLPVFRETTAIVVEADGVALSDFVRVQTVKKLIWDNIAEKPQGIVIDPNFGIPEAETLIERILALEARPVANVPIGLVAIWGLPEDEIPAGWVAHEPLAGRSPIGKDISDPDFDSTVGAGSEGGSKTKTLSIEELPAHDHGLSDIRRHTNVGGTIGFFDQAGGGANDLKTDEAGGGEPFSILGPYKIVDFIRHVGI